MLRGIVLAGALVAALPADACKFLSAEACAELRAREQQRSSDIFETQRTFEMQRQTEEMREMNRTLDRIEQDVQPRSPLPPYRRY